MEVAQAQDDRERDSEEPASENPIDRIDHAEQSIAESKSYTNTKANLNEIN